MRNIYLLLAGASLGACAMSAGPPEPPNPAAQAELARMLAGKVAQPTVNCLPHYEARDVTPIDDYTIAFRDGATVYVGHTTGLCSHLRSPSFALVTNQVGGTGLCRGDVARVVDTSAGMTVGSCIFDGFTPYVPMR